MTDFPRIVDNYLAAWNEQDPAARRKLVAEVFSDEATLTDPLAAVTGHDEIDALIEGAQAQFPGLVFTLGRPVDGHHDRARFTWHLGSAGAPEPLVIGFDVIRVDPAGQIAEVSGFLDKVPQG